MVKFPEIKIKRLILLVAMVCTIFLPVSPIIAATVEELKQQKDQLQTRLQDLNRQIASFQTQISATKKQQASLANEVFLYDAQIKTTELQILAKETQITDTNLQINELQRQIDRRIKEIAENKKQLAALIVQLHQLDANSFLQISLGNTSFSQFLDQLQYTGSVQGKVFEILQNIKAVKAQLETQQADLRQQLKKLEELKAELENTQDALEVQRRQKQKLLDQTRGLERNYQQLLATSKKEEANIQKEIDDLDAQVRARLGSRSIQPTSGALARPMEGVLTQGYGNTGFRALGYTFHNGLDYAAPAGTAIYAAASGTVNACDTGDTAYGNWCTIKHTVSTKSGNRCIITLYAHMRSIKVRAGQKVSQGDLVGHEGNTGNTTRLLYGPERGYHLHLTVFDCEGFGISEGKFAHIYGPYTVPFGYTYDPRTFY